MKLTKPPDSSSVPNHTACKNSKRPQNVFFLRLESGCRHADFTLPRKPFKAVVGPAASISPNFENYTNYAQLEFNMQLQHWVNFKLKHVLISYSEKLISKSEYIGVWKLEIGNER